MSRISAALAKEFAMNTVAGNQRTEAGAILRSGLNQVALTIPEGASGVAVLVIDSTGAEIGAAWKTKRGWTIEPSLKLAIRDGKRDLSFLTRVTW